MMQNAVNLRGDIHEGGGQILRTALALSARTGRPLQITHIRAGRSRPGLQAQHLAAVRLAALLCDAQVEGATPGSQRLSFRPGALGPAENCKVDIGTAGSMTLLLQASFWALAACPGPTVVEIRGGSDVPWSPPIDYLLNVTLPLYRHLADIETLEIKRGFFPKGQGLWRFRVTTRAITEPLFLDRKPNWQQIRGKAVASDSLKERRVAERLAECAGALLNAPIAIEYAASASPGAALVLWAEDGDLRCGATALSEKGKSSETMAGEAVNDLRRRMAASEPVEEHLADQLIPLLALIGGRIKCQEITPHCLANLEVVEAFLGPRILRRENLLYIPETV